MHRASWVAQELLITFENEISEVAIGAGEIGEFTVSVNDTLIFSRKEKQRFPEIKELKNLIKELIAPDKDLGHSSN